MGMDLSPHAIRDIDTLQQWSTSICGIQQMEGLILYYSNESHNWYHGGDSDIEVATTTDIPGGTCVLYVPSSSFLSSNNAKQEFGPLDEAEQLIANLCGTTTKTTATATTTTTAVASTDQLSSLFYLFLKILVEYDLGVESGWYPWLNSLPRIFNNGPAMTPSCYDCLPPLAARLCMDERVRCIHCRQALKAITSHGLVCDTTMKDEMLQQWVYNVIVTRSVMRDGERIIIPLADMFNHVSSGDHEVELSYDDNDGSCLVYTTTDVPAGSPLRVSYGDYYVTNPSATFAKYGFIDTSCPSIFCKMMDIIPSTELRDIGLSYSRMVFYRDTGEISEEVYDVVLYQILSEESQWQYQREFYTACMTGDAQTKAAYHAQYLDVTMAKLKEHVDTFLMELEELSEKARTKDVDRHPRLPLIVAHNDCIRQTFMRVKEKIDPIVAQTTMMYS